MADKISKTEAIENIKDHIKGCKESKLRYKKHGSWMAVADMKSRIDGLKIALDYVRKIDVKK